VRKLVPHALKDEMSELPYTASNIGKLEDKVRFSPQKSYRIVIPAAQTLSLKSRNTYSALRLHIRYESAAPYLTFPGEKAKHRKHA
jgi:hypothetical protein